MGIGNSSTHNIYDNWYKNNQSKILAGQWDLVSREILDNPEKDYLRGLNLITYLPLRINRLIDKRLISKLSLTIGDSGWIMPSKGRHITVLDILPHNSRMADWGLDAFTEKYIKVVENTISPFNKSIEIKLKGIFASPDGITIQGFPVGESLFELRHLLRQGLTKAKLANFEEKKYTVQTAHISLVKFTKPLNGKALIRTVDELRNFHMGHFTLEKLILNYSSRYDKYFTIEILKEYCL